MGEEEFKPRGGFLADDHGTRRHFKLVALGNTEWLKDEFFQGRVRFGWSGRGLDLERIRAKARSDRTDSEKITWKYTQFLVKRIRPGDRVVVQFERPLREFVIGEVKERSYEFDDANRPDFNHILHVRPLTPQPLDINSGIVPDYLKHDLTKRGHYYQIYPRPSIRTLERIVEDEEWLSGAAQEERTNDDEFDAAAVRLIDYAIREIQTRWKAKSFERFCERLCEEIDFVEITDPSDRGKGWDLLLRILNPVTGGVLLDDVPVQCKNFSGNVSTMDPIDDLKRCVENSESESPIAYLFIMGELPDDYPKAIDQAELEMEEQLGRPISFVVVDQSRIASLYIRYMTDIEPTEL